MDLAAGASAQPIPFPISQDLLGPCSAEEPHSILLRSPLCPAQLEPHIFCYPEALGLLFGASAIVLFWTVLYAECLVPII